MDYVFANDIDSYNSILANVKTNLKYFPKESKDKQKGEEDVVKMREKYCWCRILNIEYCDHHQM